ncbi:MAG: biotin--[acetyl-CoA-carboxylase] ligase, partial [Ignavibacteria bacterium]
MLINPEILNSELINKTFIEKIYYFNEIDSTNEYAKKIKDEDNILIVSEYQTSGRGRFNRIWESEKGKNLTFTIKKKFNLENKYLQIVNFYFIYFLLDAVEKFIIDNLNLRPDLEIKWPNDILLSGKKLCGLLIESNQKNFYVGIGLNVNQEKFNPEY